MYKTDVEIQKRVQEHYDKVVSLGYEVVAVMLYGSQNYNMQTKNSDIDTKAIVLPTLDDIVNDRKPVSLTIQIDDEQIDVKDIRVMFKNYLKQNINYLETLFTEFVVINPKYLDFWNELTDIKEDIAVFNKNQCVKTICGMAMEKRKALCHPYPTILDKIEKYGYDPKQLHHICRLRTFLVFYIAGVPFEDCLVLDDKEDIIKQAVQVKNWSYPWNLSKEQAIETADKWIEEMKKTRADWDDFMEMYKLDIGSGILEETKEEMNHIRNCIIKSFLKSEILKGE